MKSKLTRRLDEDVKERAKRLAEEQGGFVSRLLEEYPRLLLQKPTEGDGRSSEDPGLPEAPGEPSGSEEALSLQIQALKKNLGKPATVELPRLAGWGIALTVPPVL